MKTILTAKNVSLTLRGQRILDGLSFELWEGYVHAIVGPNGAGKSTLASAIMGLDGYQRIEGEIFFEGCPIQELSVDQRARLGITLGWQEPARFEGLTVRRFLQAGARDKSLATVRETLEQVGLDPSDYLSRAVDRTLSGGERKRIELASILAMQPRIVFLDEPDSGIDIEALKRIFEAVKVLKARGSTVVLITHSLAVLEQTEHAFLICRGRLVEKGRSRSISRYFKGTCLPCKHPNAPQEQEDLAASRRFTR